MSAMLATLMTDNGASWTSQVVLCCIRYGHLLSYNAERTCRHVQTPLLPQRRLTAGLCNGQKTVESNIPRRLHAARSGMPTKTTLQRPTTHGRGRGAGQQ